MKVYTFLTDLFRISGYEQAILGLKSRLHPRLAKALKKNKYAIDTLCFGMEHTFALLFNSIFI